MRPFSPPSYLLWPKPSSWKRSASDRMTVGLLLLVVRAATARDSQPRQHGPLLGTPCLAQPGPATIPSGQGLALPQLASRRGPGDSRERPIAQVGDPRRGAPGAGPTSGHRESDLTHCSSLLPTLLLPPCLHLKWGSVGTSGTLRVTESLEASFPPERMQMRGCLGLRAEDGNNGVTARA